MSDQWTNPVTIELNAAWATEQEGRSGEENNLLHISSFEPRTFQSVA
jgi:hypothetical protein